METRLKINNSKEQKLKETLRNFKIENRRKKILEFLTQDKTIAEIAKILKCSVSTIKNDIKEIVPPNVRHKREFLNKAYFLNDLI